MQAAIRTKDVARAVGVSRRTLLRWLHEGRIPEVTRDRNNYRIFTSEDVESIRQFADKRQRPLRFTPRTAEGGSEKRLDNGEDCEAELTSHGCPEDVSRRTVVASK